MKRLSIVLGASIASIGFSFGQNTYPATGNVGIGTNSPVEQLEVIGTSLFNGEIKVGNNPIGSEGYGKMKASNSSFSLGWKKDLSQHYGTQLMFSEHGYVSVISSNNSVGFKIQNNIDGTKYVNYYTDASGNHYVGPGASTGTPYYYIKGGGSGYVGIGTSNPTQKLEVAGSAKAEAFQLQQQYVWKLKGSNQSILAPASAGYNDWSFLMSETGSTALNTQNAKDLTLKTDSQERLRILGSNGNIGIGTISPTELLEVVGGIKIGASNNSSEGTMIYDNGKFKGYNGSEWLTFGAGVVNVVNNVPEIVYEDDARFLGELKIGSNSLHLSGYEQPGDANEIYSTDGDLLIQNRNDNSNLNTILNPYEGNVGIGTVTPGTKLEIKDASPHLNLNGTSGHGYGVGLDLALNDTKFWNISLSNGSVGYNVVSQAWDNSHSASGIGIHHYSNGIIQFGNSDVSYNGQTGQLISNRPGKFSFDDFGYFPSLQVGGDNNTLIGTEALHTSGNVVFDGVLSLGTSNPDPKSEFEIQKYGNVESRFYATASGLSSINWNMNNTYSYGFGIGMDNKGHIFKNVNALPGATEHVMTFDQEKVGIGVDEPIAKLDLLGDAVIRGEYNESAQLQLFLDESGANLPLGDRKGVSIAVKKNSRNTLIRTSETGQDLVLGAGDWEESVIVREGGQVILMNLKDGNPTLPDDNVNDYRLIVKGKIGASNIKIDADEWGDYVFEDDYELKTLEEVKSYTEEHKHLPNIPSASVVEKEGLDMSNMLNNQMVKIEELTLYMIQLNEDMKSLKEENTLLKERLNNLK